MTNSAVFLLRTRRRLFVTTIWISNGAPREMLDAFSCGCCCSALFPLADRALVKDTARLWLLFCISTEPRRLQWRRARQQGQTATHLPHIFVVVVFEVQFVCCDDFVASAVITVGIYWVEKKGNEGYCDVMVIALTCVQAQAKKKLILCDGMQLL